MNEHDGAQGGEHGGEPEQPTGRMRFQDAGTSPRQPTLAERKAREQAARRAEAERAQAAAAARSRRKRRRILIGAGVTVGVVALIATAYAFADNEESVEARCVGDDNVVVDDANCVTPASSTVYHSGGGLYPIFIGVGGRQYHYTYGGSGTVGQVATGGTTVQPKNVTVRTVSGTTISRGGLGVSSGSKGGTAGSSGGSSGS